ncbi:MAG: rane protein-like protein [Bacteroidetes bacterium]|nr:rane protein-like protein [Bacteroidota bacterium]
MLINLVFKLIFIDHYPFSYDEMISVKNTQLEFGHIKHEAEWDNNPPFYYYCLWIWVRIVNLTEFNVRFLSLLFISVGIGLYFVLVRKNLNLTTALISSGILTFSNFLTFYAHEARVYALIFLLAIVSTILFFNFLEKPDILNLFFLALINFIIIYSHYIAALIIIGQYVFIILYERKYLKKIFLYHSLIMLAFVLMRFTTKQVTNIFNFNNKGDFWLKPAKFNDLLNSISEMYFSPLIFLIILILSFALLFYYSKSISTIHKRFVCYSFIIGFISFVLLFSIGTFKAVFLSRYLIFTIPFVICFLVFATSLIDFRFPIPAIFLLIISLIGMNIKPLKGQDYRMVAKIIEQKYDLQSCILINTTDNVDLFNYYFNYTDFLNHLKKDSLLKTNRIFGVNDTLQIAENGITQFNTVYLVQSFNKKVNNKDYIQEYLKDKYQGHFYTNKFNGTEFSVFKRK